MNFFFTSRNWRAYPQIAAFAVLLGVELFLFYPVDAVAQAAVTKANRDKIIDLQLNDVHLKGDSLVASWLEMGRNTMIRTVLFRPETRDSDANKFTFDAKSCTVDEMLKAFERTYPNYVHNLDLKTGVIWLHPAGIRYDEILASKVKIGAGGTALPMETGVLDNICRFQSFGLKPGRWRGNVAMHENAFNFAVDLPKGVHSVREILNLCLADNPGYTFEIHPSQEPNEEYVSAFDLGYRNLSNPSASSIFYWHAAIGSTQGSAPDLTEIRGALCTNDPAIRNFARGYLEVNQPADDTSLNALFPNDATAEETVMNAVSVAAVYVRCDLTASPSALWLKRTIETSPAPAISGGLKALASVALASTSTQPETDAADMGQMAKQSLTQEDLRDVKYDLIRILRYSPRMRQKLAELNPPWAGFSKAEIESLGKMDTLFSLP